MAIQKPSDFTKYKFNALKTYTSTEWLAESRKKYRQVFDRSEIAYIYAEFSFYNKLFDEEDWEAEINLKAYSRPASPKQAPEQICDIEVNKSVSKDLNIVYIREGWGMDKKGAFWKEGSYFWEAYIDGEMVGTCNFFVYEVGAVTAEDNPYLAVDRVYLYEGSNTDSRRPEDRPYCVEFSHTDTRFIWIEFHAINRLSKDWKAEVIFNFYNDARQLKGRTTELVSVTQDQKAIVITSGWGSDHKGTWFADNYTVEIVFMDTLIGIVPFQVGEETVEGESSLLLPDDSGSALVGIPTQEELDNQSLEEVLSELDSMIGLESIKTRVREYSQYLKFLNLRKEKGFDDNQQLNLHVIFAGNPGTGKTTVARMLGKIYKKLGLLSKGHVHEVDRSDIVGEYIGQTAPKVRAAIDKARGGILFIDEAYALARSKDDPKDYGREVVELLVKEMSSPKGDLAIVVAGYPKEMDTFMESNPGLKSRFAMRFDFPDYTPQELQAIALFGAEKASVTLEPSAMDYLSHQLTESFRSRDRSFGNARYALSLVNEAKMNLGLRIMRSDNIDDLTKEDLSVIRLEDVQEIFEPQSQQRVRIPIDESLLSEALHELDTLIGLQSVKTEVHELVKLVRFYKEIGKDVLNRFSLHTVFTGNPGTGKTTVARIIGKIYKALGILERGSVIECDRQMLVAGYVGQTAIKTAEIIDRARGGVLFIDEAYSLSQGGQKDFGQEAIDTLLKRMEDLRGELVVIAAGYPDRMRTFLESNPGLKSRFDRKLEFPDYVPDELLSIALGMFAIEQVSLEAEAAEHLMRDFEHLHRYKNKFFGNARAVRKVVEKAIKNQHLRLASLSAEARTKDMLAQLTLADVAEFEAGNDSLLEGGNQGRVGF
ncbi:MAG: AAA family ATPase [Bacteroidetes bacterium]|nr:MAG: AAA family ATPase [Bacteroidota bacterium]